MAPQRGGLGPPRSPLHREADKALAQPLDDPADDETPDVEGLRDYLDGLGHAPMPRELDCSQRAFVSYLEKLVDSRVFYKIGRGSYRLHPFRQVREVLETEEVDDRLLGERQDAIGLNLRGALDGAEERLLDRVGDVLAELARIVAIVQAGPDPEQLPDELTEELVLRAGPLPFEAREEVEFALAVPGSPDVDAAKEFGGETEAYEKCLRRLRSSLDGFLDDLQPPKSR